MADAVDCSECGMRYDSDEHPFCPRCGSVARNAPVAGALASARRMDPGRRRVQASGAMLAAVGALLVVLFTPILFLAQPFMQKTLDQIGTQQPEIALPGGTLVVTARDNATPLAGAPVNVTTPTGVAVVNGTTDANGTFTTDLGPHGLVRVSVGVSNGTMVRNAVALQGLTTRLSIQRSDGLNVEGWSGVGPLLVLVRIIIAAFLVVALLMVAAGVLAMRLRAWGFCVGAGAVGMIPALLLFVASPSVGFLLMLAVLAVPVGLIAAGRRQFHDQRSGPPR